MTRLALERALPATWVDEVFETHRHRQYPRELMFPTIVELMTLVTLGLRPSLNATARKMGNLPVLMAALYDKLNRTEPTILRGLEAFSYHLAEHIKSGYEGMRIALPAEHWPSAAEASAQSRAQRLLHLARRISPKQVTMSKRGPHIDKPKGYVDGSIARTHVYTARVLKKTRAERP
ncbi:hypothetical protein [Ralstonia solanacearum]|uniref:Transposase n=1 Tax=Ralstonia solanacearum TaxID=305 RepID=A0AAE3NGB5_RALSL|nr:hypothetical protein [Ralstonia solanacearum]MBB6583828.1 hypothetical protein [Ralstonia solanacearum]MDB0521740.1 hypothetical protein [Ralstonia solanacearum]